jgi:hypothetical protein
MKLFALFFEEPSKKIDLSAEVVIVRASGMERRAALDHPSDASHDPITRLVFTPLRPTIKTRLGRLKEQT